MKLPDQPTLINARTGEPIRAKIDELKLTVARVQVDRAWWVHPDLDQEKAAKEPDRSWGESWEATARAVERVHTSSLIGCFTSNPSTTEGVMLFSWDEGVQSELASGKQAVFIDLLATAPHNRKTCCTAPRCRGVGMVLLQYAAAFSMRMGLQGRLLLDSVNDPNTLNFYGKCGFQLIGPGQGDTLRTELAAEHVQAFLNRRLV